jgi:hypothetical protein
LLAPCYAAMAAAIHIDKSKMRQLAADVSNLVKSGENVRRDAMSKTDGERDGTSTSVNKIATARKKGVQAWRKEWSICILGRRIAWQ